MKRVFFFLLSLAGCVAFAPLALAESIEQFNVDLAVEKTGAVRVIETILYNFDGAERHGIYRDIPVRYTSNKGASSITLRDIRVIDENGVPYQFTQKRAGKYTHIQIGDPDVLITGEHVYRIMYTVERALGFFDTHDELYWNVTGNGWDVPIAEAVARVQMPASVINSGDLRAACFVGPFGSANACTSAAYLTGDPMVVTFTGKKLAPGEGLTIVAAVPTGTIARPSRAARLWYFVKDNLVVGVPVIVCLVMFFFWYTRGRDAKGRGTIIPEYDVPDDLLPSQLGGLLDNTVHPRDLSADIIQLAILGYIKISRIEKSGLFGKVDYRLDRLKTSDKLDKPILRQTLDGLFAGKSKSEDAAVLVSELKNKFFITAQKISKEVFASLVNAGYLKQNPAIMRGFFMAGAIGCAIILSNVFLHVYGFVGVVSGVLSGIAVAVFGFLMPARTEKGALAREKILGLKMYLTVAEKDRIAFHNAPEKNPETFEKFLPYAMAMKVEKVWAKQFESIHMEPPRWYNDPTLRTFNAVTLSSSLGGFTSASGAVISRASGGGSGFSGGGSGGGMGGGGGGSW